MSTEHLATPGLPVDPGGPVFAEAWEAEIFAATVALADAGCFSWAEWTQMLSAAIHDAQAKGDSDVGDSYYHHWLAALEQLCHAKGFVEPADVEARAAQWRRAYLNTPHGRPVELRAVW